MLTAHRSVRDGEGGTEVSRFVVVPLGVVCGNQKVALAPRLLLDRLPLATSHLSGDDRRANPS